tara:strand:- start:5643 stop:6224 length:582 start_codon:yes stop_codon:yes gene_type:complete
MESLELFPLQANQTLDDAYFTNDEFSVVKVVIITRKDNGEYERTEDFLQASGNDVRWQQLLDTGMSVDKLYKNSDINIERQKNDYFAEMSSVAEAYGMKLVDKDEVAEKAESNEEVFSFFINKLLSTITNSNSDTDQNEKETLFLYKIAIFESETVKNSDNRKLKTELRRAKNILECVKVACEIALEVNNNLK